MKKLVFVFLLLIVSVFCVQPVNAEFYDDLPAGSKYDTGIKTLGPGQSYVYKSLYMYSCASTGSTKYNELGIYRSNDPISDKSTGRCSDGQTPSVYKTGDECYSNRTCNTNKKYYCIKSYTITCPSAKTTQAPVQPQPQPTSPAVTQKTTTRAKTTSPNGSGKKTTTTTTQQTTEPTTEPTTETTPISNNVNIKSILVNKQSIGYKDSKDEYRFRVSYGTKSLNIDVELEDDSSSYRVIGGDSLDDEKETEEILVEVMAQDGETTKTVKLIAEKFKPSESDCTLANIYIKDYSIDYEKNTFDYGLTLGKEVNSLDIETITQYDGQIVNVSGNEKLKNKSKIVIEVEAPSGETCTYTIKVKKNSSVGKYIVIIVVLLLALGVAGYFLYRYINKSNGLYKYE